MNPTDSLYHIRLHFNTDLSQKVVAIFFIYAIIMVYVLQT